jgi:hypothetical protein
MYWLDFLTDAGLNNTVIALPRIVPQIHDNRYERTAGTDPYAWGVSEVIAMVRSLAHLSGATTMPSVEEWAVLSDKVCFRTPPL